MEAEYSNNGKQMFKECCSTDENQPTMLPRAPEQTYIDIYPDEDQPGPSFRDDKRRQSDYETEVKMYRALEGLDGNYFVLHSFKYTHEQYCMCDRTHVRKGCNKYKFRFNVEGGCDFLIICPNSFVVIEVKNMEHVPGKWVECEPNFHLCSIGEDWGPECTTRDMQLRALIGTYRKSAEQRNKVVELIRCIDKDPNILQFTAYPNFSKRFKDQFQLSEIAKFRLSDDELSTFLFKEDICRKDLRKSFINSVSVESTCLTEQTSQEKARDILLAIWATEKDKCDQSKCSLGRCILDINKELKEENIIFEPKPSKKRAANPGVVKAPDVIRNYVGVLNLTISQNSVFNSNKNMMWINGPAGTGKTVILCGKIIQLIQSDSDNKVVLFTFTGDGKNSQHYWRALDNAGIQYERAQDNAGIQYERALDNAGIQYERALDNAGIQYERALDNTGI